MLIYTTWNTLASRLKSIRNVLLLICSFCQTGNYLFLFFTAASVQDIEDFFDIEEQTIRQYFPPSFSFVDIAVDGKKE